jgi:uncharacterized protein (TIGR02118 family)
MNRRDLISLDEFRELYLEHTNRSREIPGVLKYVASTAIQGVNGGEPPFDAVAELWWEDLDAVRNSYLERTWNATRTEHTSFLSGRFMFECDEYNFLSPPEGTSAVKYMAFLNRKDGLGRDEFRSYFLETHVPRALETPNLLGYRASIAICSANGDSLLKETPDAAPFDGVVEMWFADVDSFDAAFRDPHWETLRLDYYDNFAQGLMQVLVEEHLLFDHLTSGGVANGSA